MYTHNEVGPWPIFDLSQAKVIETTSGTWTTVGNALNVHLDSDNLGSKEEAYTNVLYKPSTPDVSIAAGSQLAFGVCLKPLEDVSRGYPVYIDFNIAASTHYDAAQSVIPFVGFIDTAGAAISQGWNGTHNLCTNYCVFSGESYTKNATPMQVLIKDVNSGGLDLDKFVCIGAFIRSIHKSNTIDVNYAEFSISARYATKAINTTGRGV